MCLPRLFISKAALLPSMLRLPAMSPEFSAGSLPFTSRPMVVTPEPVAARSAVAPLIGPGPFCPKK